MAEFAYSDADRLAAKFAFKSKEMPALTREVARDVGDFMVDAARTLAPKRTGRMARSIRRTGVTRTGPDTWTVAVGSDLHRAVFTEYGTGWYDPAGSHYIFPKTAKVMKWVERGPFATRYTGSGIFSSQLRGGKNPRYAIFARYTRGQEGQHFFGIAQEMTDNVYIPGRLRELSIRIIND